MASCPWPPSVHYEVPDQPLRIKQKQKNAKALDCFLIRVRRPSAAFARTKRPRTFESFRPLDSGDEVTAFQPQARLRIGLEICESTSWSFVRRRLYAERQNRKKSSSQPCKANSRGLRDSLNIRVGDERRVFNCSGAGSEAT